MLHRLTAAALLGLLSTAASAQEIDHAALRESALAVLDADFSAFQETAAELSATAQAVCHGEAPPDALKAALATTWLAWAPLDSFQFGPIEQSGAALAVDFWPDKKGFVTRGVAALQALPEADQARPETVAAGSVAAQGLPALELLLYGDGPLCPAAMGIAAHLSLRAAALHQAWFGPDGWAEIARAAGPMSPVYRTQAEFSAALFTALDFGLFRATEQRLGRPLGTWERSFPQQAEAWRSGLSVEIVDAQLIGIARMLEQGFGGTLDPDARDRILARRADARMRLDQIGAPLPEVVTDPARRVRVEAVQTLLREIRASLANDIGAPLGLSAGFSPADGD